MKKMVKKLAATALALTMCASSVAGLAACGGNDKDDVYEPITGAVKIGVLTAADYSEEGSEANNWYKYLNAMGPEYNFTFTYSQVITDSISAKSEAETLAAAGCQVIMDMGGKERPAIADYCEDEKIYYVVAAGVMSDTDFNDVKTNHYFLGQIGPDFTAEYNAGYEMGSWFKTTYCVNNANPKVSLYAGFAGVDPAQPHRFAGLLDGLGLKYDGATASEKTDKIMGDAISTGIQASQITGSGLTVNYVFSGFGEIARGSIDNMPNDTEYLLGISMNNTFNSTACMQRDPVVKFTDIDAFTGWAMGNMSSGALVFEAGKLQSDLGPVVALIKQAVDGKPIRDNGNAVSISQNFHYAKNAAEFASYMESDGYVYNKTKLDTIIATTTVEAFKAAM